jgi:oligopeptide/dipeptide ABC transporter ATP-binding protein
VWTPSGGRAILEAMPLLSVADLKTWFFTEDGIVRAVDGVSFSVNAGETLAVVGESGSGKSVMSLSIMRLLPEPVGRIVAGSIRLAAKDGTVHDLARLDDRAMERIRGNDIAMVFQEPMTSLNPVFPVGNQIAEGIARHQDTTRHKALALAAAMLEKVGIADPGRRLLEYPHQLSGGMRQRVMIAMALGCAPRLLIADEPTTALDVTIQAQILDLLRQIQRSEEGTSILFITHNLGVVAEMAHRVIVMYSGRIVEEAGVEAIFKTPKHPYTIGLLGSLPRVDRAATHAGRKARLRAIPGNLPNPLADAVGCAFAPRCSMVEEACRTADPPLVAVAPGHLSRCLRWAEL